MPHGQDEPRVGAVFDGRFQVASVRHGDDGLLTCGAVRLGDLRPVTLLLGRAGAAAEAEAARAFARDGERLATLRHPHLVATLEAGVGPGGRPYLVVEPVEGRGLPARMAEEAPYTPRRVAALGGDLLCALEGLHQRGVALGGLSGADVTVLALGAGREVAAVAPGGVVRRPSGRSEAQDLAGAGALMAQLLTGVAPRPGAPFAPTLAGAPVVGPLVAFIGRCLEAGGPGGFASASAALEALGRVDPEATETAPGARAPVGELRLTGEEAEAPPAGPHPPAPWPPEGATDRSVTQAGPGLVTAVAPSAPAPHRPEAPSPAEAAAPAAPLARPGAPAWGRLGWLLVLALAAALALWRVL